MPDAPPCGNNQHASVGREVRKQAGSKHQGKAQAGILDSCFNSESPAVAERDFKNGTYGEANGKSQQVMYQNHKEDVFYALQECIHVASETQDNHCKEEDDGNPLKGLLQRLGHLGKVL